MKIVAADSVYTEGSKPMLCVRKTGSAVPLDPEDRVQALPFGPAFVLFFNMDSGGPFP
jgi:hypothetical protein